MGRWSDGHAFCFVCGYRESAAGTPAEYDAEKDHRKPGLKPGEYAPIRKRCLREETLQHYDYRLGVNEQYATYYDKDGRAVAQKGRDAAKGFRWYGESKKALLFGQQCAQGSRRIVVTEGELDAMSVGQATNLKWPAVSVANGAQGAAESVRKSLEFLEGFEAVVFMFDEDEPGRKAALECAALLSPGKAHIATLPLKDANEMLQAGREGDLVNAMWRAKEYRPDGIVSMDEDLWQEIIQPRAKTEALYPYAGLNAKLFGLRTGEVVTFCAGTGVGKSTACREIAYSLSQQGERVGYVALEEHYTATLLSLMSIHLNRPLHLQGFDPEDPAVRQAYDTLRESGVEFYDHWGSSETDVLLAKMRYMSVGLGCKWIFLDHISIVVSGLESQNERKDIDVAMTRCASLARECKFGLVIVSHLRKGTGTSFEEGGQISLADLRGTAAIAQLSDAVVALERDQQSEDKYADTTVRVLKNRFAGQTGVCGYLDYNTETGRLMDGERSSDPFAAGTPEGGGEPAQQADF